MATSILVEGIGSVSGASPTYTAQRPATGQGYTSGKVDHMKFIMKSHDSSEYSCDIKIVPYFHKIYRFVLLCSPIYFCHQILCVCVTDGQG